MTNMGDLRRRIAALPEPYRRRAKGNLDDAMSDLISWPDYCHKIVADLEQAVQAHEQDAKEAPDAD